MNEADIITEVLRREGGAQYTDHPADRGGPTKWGITLDTLSRWRNHRCTPADVEAMAETEARAIYAKVFILEPGFHRIEDQALRVQLVDFGVVSGPARAIRWLQRTIGTPVTGVLDPGMFDTLRQLPPRLVNNALVAARLTMIDRLTDADVKQRAFEEGWESRALQFVIL